MWAVRCGSETRPAAYHIAKRRNQVCSGNSIRQSKLAIEVSWRKAVKKIFGCSGWNCPVFCRCRLRAVSWRFGIMKLISSSVFFAIAPRFSDCSYAARNDAFAIRFAAFFSGPAWIRWVTSCLRYMLRRFVAAFSDPVFGSIPSASIASAFAIASKRYLRRRREGRARQRRARRNCAPRNCAGDELRGRRKIARRT